MSYRFSVLLAGLGSAALFFGALGFQFIGGVAPCEMCFWQRWPHRVAILLAVLAYFLPARAMRLAMSGLGAAAMLVSFGLAAYHTGVERAWWEGPSTCTSRGLDLSSECGLLDPNCGVDIVLCDEISWQLFGLSMANYNAVFSLVFLSFWIAAMRRA